jgi:hypothetical protein
LAVSYIASPLLSHHSVVQNISNCQLKHADSDCDLMTVGFLSHYVYNMCFWGIMFTICVFEALCLQYVFLRHCVFNMLLVAFFTYRVLMCLLTEICNCTYEIKTNLAHTGCFT